MMSHSYPIYLILFYIVTTVVVYGSEDLVCNNGGIRTDCCHDVNDCDSNVCESRGCCWNPIGVGTTAGVPYCFKPNPIVKGYELSKISTTSYGFDATLELVNGNNVYGKDITPLGVKVYMETKERIHVKIYDPKNSRWEVPRTIVSKEVTTKPTTTDYTFSYTKYPFGFAVTRTSTGEVIFNSTTNGAFNGLIFEDQYLEISTQLTKDSNIYGLGERVHSLKLTKNAIYTLWAIDEGTPPNVNLYASHPFYLELRGDTGNAHGVFLLNSNGMDVYLSDTELQYRVIGGILDFYIFTGPTPENVISQYTEVIGRPYMPPYWALGWHQCRYGYHTIQDVENVVKRYKEHNIPLETMWTDIDYMNKYLDWTFDPTRYPVATVKSFVEGLHNNGQHYVVITDCGIRNISSYPAYTEGSKVHAWIYNADGTEFVGKVWPGYTVWPDFFNPATQDYWYNSIKGFLDMVPLDGLWTDMNEISNFCNGNCEPTTDILEDKRESSIKNTIGFNPTNPPYPINNKGDQSPLNTKTIAPDAIHYNKQLAYNLHNMYGFSEANATRLALEKYYGKRAFVLSRSTFPGHGRVANHWLGDNDSTWKDLYFSIAGILNFQMFGIPLVGADICGFNGATTMELCARWMELGVFYPFTRNHNSINEPSQEPYVWPEVASISIKVINAKYTILPYYYTQFYQAHTNGLTVARPLFFEFPLDSNVTALDWQFLVGTGFMISPVLLEGDNNPLVYFPAGVWYDFWTHEVIYSGTKGDHLTLYTPLDHIQLHIRGGTIIPTQESAMVLREARKNPFGLLIALDGLGEAQGYNYIDDGEDISVGKNAIYTQYTAKDSSVSASVLQNKYNVGVSMTSITVLGVSTAPSSATLNGKSISSFTYNSTSKELSFTSLNISMVSNFTLVWK